MGHRIALEVMPDGHIAVHTGLGGREHEYPEDIYALVPGCRKPPQLPAQLQRRRNVNSDSEPSQSFLVLEQNMR